MPEFCEQLSMNIIDLWHLCDKTISNNLIEIIWCIVVVKSSKYKRLIFD